MMKIHFLGLGQTACQKPGPPGDWKDDDKWSGDWKDVTCPECLRGREYQDLYTIQGVPPTITCRICHRTSSNPKDVEQRWCGHCSSNSGASLDDIWPPARQWCIEHPEAFDFASLRELLAQKP